jgi:type I restriction enzyme M protein
LQTKCKDSEKLVDSVHSIDKATFDLSLKNPNKPKEAALCDPKDIIAEIAATESAEILAGTGRML